MNIKKISTIIRAFKDITRGSKELILIMENTNSEKYYEGDDSNDMDYEEFDGPEPDEMSGYDYGAEYPSDDEDDFNPDPKAPNPNGETR